MNNKLLLGGIGLLIIVVLAGGLLFLNNSKNASSTTQTTQTQEVTPTVSEISPSPSASPSGESTKHQTVTVTLTSTGFNPASVTIKPGDTVVWKNQSGETAIIASNPHPIHTDYPPLNLGSFQNGDSLKLAFSTPGTYGYHDHLNPSEKGTVIVK